LGNRVSWLVYSGQATSILNSKSEKKAGYGWCTKENKKHNSPHSKSLVYFLNDKGLL